MERREPQEIHPHVVPRQVVAGGQPGLVEIHGPFSAGEQTAAEPDFHVSEGGDDADRVAWRHVWFNGSGDIAIPLVSVPWLMAVDVEQFAGPGGRPTEAGHIGKVVNDELGPRGLE